METSGLSAKPDLLLPDRLLPDLVLDVSAETCPMTFVRTRLALDRLPAGAVLAVRFHGEEPRRNLPRTAEEQGHAVLSLEELEGGYGRLVLRKGSAKGSANTSASRPAP